MTEQILFSLPLDRLEPIFKGWIADVIKKNPISIPTPPAKKPITPKEVADLLGIKVPTVYGRTHRKKIPFMKRGGRLYFDEAEIIEWLKSSRRLTHNEIKQITADSLDR